MLDIYTDLAWLPRAPADLRQRVRELAAGDGPAGDAARALATHALGVDQLTQLGRALDRLSPERRAPLAPMRLGLIGNGSLDLLPAPLKATAARHGLDLEVVRGDYDQTLQDALSPTSAVNAAGPDVVLLALDWRGLPLRPAPGAPEEAQRVVEDCLDFIDRIRAGVARNCGAVCLVSNFAAPPESVFGSLDRRLPGTVRHLLDAINRGLAERLEGGLDVLLDVAGLAETVGLGRWYDPAQWNLAKLAFSTDLVPLYADHVARLLGALRGKSRRLLVLDLDNTLWGGVIGDDGMAGIALAQGDAAGEAHLAVQAMALALRERGVVLAVCSKNDDSIAREVFASHPEMLLRQEHIAVFQANWRDKGTNIKAIADELALGLESVVFLDDNPVERGLVRRSLPQVAVPELGDDPAYFSRTLAAAGYFELINFSAEDRQRAELYQKNAQRVALKEQVGDLDAYLESLQMEIIFSPFDLSGRARISQLINKSNQFNLTTRRYSEPEVQALAEDPAVVTLQVRLKDAFGDNGMISVVVGREREGGVLEIDTWLMSCRVLGRGVERMVLHEILQHAQARGLTKVLGIYLPTSRNAMVSEHYAQLGFTRVADAPDGGSVWELASDALTPSAPMAVRRLGFGRDAPA